MVEVISGEKFKNEIFDYSTKDTWSYDKEMPTILNFTASWCGPCRMFAPTLDKVADEYGGKIKVFKIDIDQNPEVPSLFGVMSVPTTLFISRGEDPAIANGVIQYDDMIRAITELFGLPKAP